MHLDPATPDELAALFREYDGPTPPRALLAARYGYRAHDRITTGADMAVHQAAAKGYARIIKKLGPHDEAYGRLLANTRFHVDQWRKLRAKYREIMREIEAVRADRIEAGRLGALYRVAAE